MRVALLTREYPPEVYGGAGVHVEYLARELARREELTVHCWGEPRDDAARRRAPRAGTRWSGRGRIWRRCRRCRSTSRWPQARTGAELVHSHTWYANSPATSRSSPTAIPHVATVHTPRAAAAVEGRAARRRLRDLELLRAGSPIEGADAVIAVSSGCGATSSPRTRRRPGPRARHPQRHRRGRVPPRPGHRRAGAVRHRSRRGRTSCSSVGSRGRRAVPTCSRRRCSFDPAAQLVLCAGEPDTPTRRGGRSAGRAASATERGAWSGIEGCCRSRTLIQVLSPRDRVRLPVDLRAVRHRQPRGDGV